MKHRIAAGLLALSTGVASPGRSAEPAAAASKIDGLAFLAGSWITEDGPARIEEHWTCPGPGAMFGMGRTIAKGKTAFFEYLRIEERPDGVFYVAQPKGNPPTPFKLVKSEAGSVVFENPEHDFPKRILYAKGPGDTLVARVEGGAASKEKAEEFRYRRLAEPRCP